jgi:hypothetical protein
MSRWSAKRATGSGRLFQVDSELIAKRARIFSEARDQLLGHRPKDTKVMHYEDEDMLLPLLAEEIAKLPALLDVEQDTAATTAQTTESAGNEATSSRIEPISNRQVLVPVLVTQATPWSGLVAFSNDFSGGGGIRTHGTLTSTPVFKMLDDQCMREQREAREGRERVRVGLVVYWRATRVGSCEVNHGA